MAPLRRTLSCWGLTTALLSVARLVSAEALEHWSTVAINTVAQTEPALVLRSDTGELYTRAADLQSWNLPFPASGETLRHRGLDMVRIASRPGLAVDYRPAAQHLDLTVEPWLLPGHPDLVGGNSPTRLTSGPAALFGNYQVYAQRGAFDSLAAAASLGASRGRTSFRTDWLYTHPAGGMRRLDTALQIDVPERRARFTAGDTVSVAGVGERAWRHAGLQWTTDFDLDPQLPTFALPAAQGMATVPTAVDLYVNGALVSSREVQPGPFVFADIPVPAGPGTVVLRMRDALGREQTLEQRFLATPLLLPAGVSTQALEAGVIRRGYGLEDFRYGPAFAAASLRHGLGARTTLQGNIELSRDTQAVRAATAVALGDHVVAQAGVGLGSHLSATGWAADLALDLQSRALSVAFVARVLDHRYADLAMLSAGERHSGEWSVQVSPRLPFAASVGLVHTQRESTGTSRDVGVSTLFASFARVAGGSLVMQVSRIEGTHREMRFATSYVRSLGSGLSTGAGLSRGARGTDLDWQIGRNAPRDAGWGWQLGTRRGDSTQHTARVETRTRLGYGHVDAGKGPSGEQVAASWSGGWLWAANTLAATPPLSEAVAIIETPGLTGARVLHDGQTLGRTNANGRLVATALRAYEPNQLRLEADEAPVSAWIENIDHMVAPYANGVVHVRFVTRPSTLRHTLRLPDGSFVPPGARVRWHDRDYPVGESGRVSLPQIDDVERLIATWNGNTCVAAVSASLDEFRELTCHPAP